MHGSSLRAALANVFQIPLRPALRSPQLPAHGPLRLTPQPTVRTGGMLSKPQFSTTTAHNARSRGGARPDRRITLIRFFLHHPTTLTPRPLRFSRNRYLRHWTITRAWNLYRHNVKKAREMELERQYNAMRDANEELRLGAGDGGRLFRKAQMKTGVWGLGSGSRKGGVPIEYARGLVEWVGSTGGLGVGTQTEGDGEGDGEGEGDAAGASAAAKQAKIWDHAWKRH
ncbi:hypothetical protein PV04_08262 [Phialophora macrospora]|uniref:Large ribosomal subunit protein mL40 n=1 Tax=Phialophora macrospora TaxID=1851006 RepID=A0A0D2FH39_9EURO|nr:hypothetical protein PV04_08262 [Phialophora macrospora]